MRIVSLLLLLLLNAASSVVLASNIPKPKEEQPLSLQQSVVTNVRIMERDRLSPGSTTDQNDHDAHDDHMFRILEPEYAQDISDVTAYAEYKEICNTESIHQFEATVVLDLVGYPNLLTWTEKSRIGTVLRKAYNELVNCGIDGPYRQIESTQFQDILFLETDAASPTPSLFTLEYLVRGSCQGCRTYDAKQMSQLFNTMTDSYSCPCAAPTLFSYRALLRQRIQLLMERRLANSIIALDLVSEVVPAPTCPDPTNFTTSDVVVAYYGCPTELVEDDFFDLGEQFRAVYNRINGKNAKYCDPYFRQVVSAIPVYMNDTNVPTTGRQRHRHLFYATLDDDHDDDHERHRTLQDRRLDGLDQEEEGCVLEYFEVRFEISAICRGCDISTITLFDEPQDANFDVNDLYNTPALRRERHLMQDDHDDEEEEMPNSRLLSDDDGDECQCPLDPSFRAVTESEALTAFNATISHSALIAVVDLYEVLPVSCDPDVETFETTVDVDFEFESEDGVISQEAIDAFVHSFLLSYNSLQARYCDPYFREVAAAEVVDQTIVPTRRRDRSLQIRKPPTYTIKFRISVIGACRGCATKNKLFVNDAVARRLQLPEQKLFPAAETNTKFRRVQSDNDQCFCAVANVAYSAPTEREFLESYNEGMSGLAAQLGTDYVVTQVNEEGGDGNADDGSRIECLSDAMCVDSNKGDLCINYSCIHVGNPRITLTWEGNDDLDLAVYTPDGVRIAYDASYDEVTGGSFDTLFSQEVDAPHVESIFFPMRGAPPGTYVIEVFSWRQEDVPDDWTVQVFTADSDTVPVIITQGTGNRDDILFDFGEAGVAASEDACSTSKLRTECCEDDDCVGDNQRCANRQCVTRGVRTFTLSWTGNDDYFLTVLTPKGGIVNAGSLLDPYSGAVFEADKNMGALSRSSHTQNVYFPEGYPGGEYFFYVDATAQRGAAEEWALEVIEFGETVLVESGYGNSRFLQYTAPECTTDDHCRDNDICFESKCIVDGTPRFVLTWDGDDDLDLSVLPPAGNRVDYWNRFDAESGGTVQVDATPSGTSHVESIYYGVALPAQTGRYRIRVNPYDTLGDASDSWTLTATVRGTVLRTWTGVGAGFFRFWYSG